MTSLHSICSTYSNPWQRRNYLPFLDYTNAISPDSKKSIEFSRRSCHIFHSTSNGNKNLFGIIRIESSEGRAQGKGRKML